MRIYEISISGFEGTCAIDTLEETKQEIADILPGLLASNNGTLTVKVHDVPQEEFDNWPEFEGY